MMSDLGRVDVGFCLYERLDFDRVDVVFWFCGRWISVAWTLDLVEDVRFWLCGGWILVCVDIPFS